MRTLTLLRGISESTAAVLHAAWGLDLLATSVCYSQHLYRTLVLAISFRGLANYFLLAAKKRTFSRFRGLRQNFTSGGDEDRA